MKLDAIISPMTTEKSSQAQEKGMYTFLVRRDATKIDVKQAFEHLYGEKVASVKMTYIRPKTRVIGKKTVEKRKTMKKAILTLKGRKKIDILSIKIS